MSERDPKDWIHYPVSDWTDYLDKGATVYERDGALYDFASDRKIRDLSPEELRRSQKARRQKSSEQKSPSPEEE